MYKNQGMNLKTKTCIFKNVCVCPRANILQTQTLTNYILQWFSYCVIQ